MSLETLKYTYHIYNPNSQTIEQIPWKEFQNKEHESMEQQLNYDIQKYGDMVVLIIKNIYTCLVCKCNFTNIIALTNHKCDSTVFNPTRDKPQFAELVENLEKANKQKHKRLFRR